MSRPMGRMPFAAANVLMWLVMTLVLIVVPDVLARWLSMELARLVGWAVASGLWVVALQAAWRRRVGPLTLFGLQVLIWVSAATVAIWLSAMTVPEF